MSADETIYTMLTTNATLARVYPVRLPKSATLPCAVYNIEYESGEYALDGSTGVYDAIIDVDLYATSMTDINTQQALIYNNLSGFTGTVGSIEVFSTNIDDVSTAFSEEMEVYVRTITIGLLYKQ